MVVNPLKGKTIAQIADMARQRGASEAQIGAGFQAIGQQPTQMQPPQQQQPIQPIQPTQPTGGQFAFGDPRNVDAGMRDIAAMDRRPPTVATPTQPVVNTQVVSGLDFDESNPDDFIMRLNARNATGGKLSEQDLYNYQRALSIKQQQQTEIPSPFQDMLAQQQAELEAMRAEQEGRRGTALDQKRAELDAKYGELVRATEEAGARRQQATQAATSFSGFGRSTFNQQQQDDIAKSTSAAIVQLENAKQLELQAFEAEMQGIDAEALAPLYEQIRLTQQAANKFQLDAIAKAAEINAQTGANLQSAITNLLNTAGQSGMMLNPDDPKNLEAIANAINGMTPDMINEYLSNFDEPTQALILGAAVMAGQKGVEIPKIQQIGKNQYGYFDPATGQLVRIGGGVGIGGVGGGGAGVLGTTVAGEDLGFDPSLASVYRIVLDAKSLDIQRFTKLYNKSAPQLQKEAENWKRNTLSNDVSVALDTIDNLKSKYPGRASLISGTSGAGGVARAFNPQLADYIAQYNYIKDNLTMEKLISLKDSGATFGALSDSERIAIGNAASAISPDMSKEQFLKQLSIIENTFKKSVGGKDPRKATTTTTPTTTTRTTTATGTTIDPNKVRSFTTEAIRQGATAADIQAYIRQNPAQFR